jgi:pilus assembly protein FimV
VQVDLDVTRPMPEPGTSDFMGLVDPKLKRGDSDRY